MSVQGKQELSFQKKDTENQRTLGVGFEKLIFFHQSTVGDASINLGTLTLPTDVAAAGFLNPSASKLVASNIKFWRNNFKLFSSIRGELWDYLTYDVVNSSLIAFKNGFTALDGEIFKGEIDLSARTGLLVVEGRSIVASGELEVGQTDVYIPEGFELNKYPTTQLGAVLVSRNGIGPMLRNEGNVPFTPGVKGNYQEVAGPGGVGSIIRFNTAAALRPDGSKETYAIYSNGLVAERPAQSMLAFLESIGGQVNSMLPYLAAAAGVPVSTFGANPTSIDLAAFGNVVKNLRTGVVDNSSAKQGEVGEYIESLFSGISLINNAVVNLGSLVISPGDWDVSSVFGWLNTGASNPFNLGNQFLCALSTLNNDLGSAYDTKRASVNSTTASTGTGPVILGVPSFRVSTASPITLYSNVLAYVSGGFVGNNYGFGRISARRVR